MNTRFLKLSYGNYFANSMSYEISTDVGERHAEVTLKVLNAVEGNDAITQRTLARDLGVALGIANATLKRCIEKGLIKVRQAPARRYAYYLTPSGFAEKSKLTGQYFAHSLRFFIHAQSACASLLQSCASRGWRRIVLAGSGELLEIVRLCARDQSIELVAVIDDQVSVQKVSGLSVVKALDDVPVSAYDAVLVIDSVTPLSTVEAIRSSASKQKLPDERVLLLRLVPLTAAVEIST